MITYSTTAYVDSVGQEVFGIMETELSSWADGDENICINIDSLNEWIEEHEAEVKSKVAGKSDTLLRKYLKTIMPDLIFRGAGDVIFTK